MFLNSTLILFKYLTLFLISIQFSITSAQDYVPDYCLQNRVNSDCKETFEDFCKNIQCDSTEIEDCDTDSDYAIVEHATGRRCCPACVKYLEEGDECQIGSKQERCKNGLNCDTSTKKCALPRVKTKCLRESHNRRYVQDNPTHFYINGFDTIAKENISYYMQFSNEIDQPDCNFETGNYELKQCKKSKCFCVDPEDGHWTFGMAPFDLANNVTCKCAEAFTKTLSVGNNQNYEQVDIANMEHYSEIHAKCNDAGNFEPLQCINGTCFCVDEKTGKPTQQKGAIYGALAALPCFDEEKAKKLGSKESDINYQSACEQTLMKSQSIKRHFNKKGTEIRGELIQRQPLTCSFDGKFAARQCNSAQCFCVSPEDAGRLASYNLDRLGGQELQMECRCAREEYYKSQEKKAYEVLQCDGSGNFKPFQCFENNRKCYCVDEDGGRIGIVEPTLCIDTFIKEYAPGLKKDEMCKGMIKLLKELVIEDGKYFRYDKDNLVELLKEKPANMFTGCQES